MTEQQLFKISDKTLKDVRYFLENGYLTVRQIAKVNDIQEHYVKKFIKAYDIKRPKDYENFRKLLRLSKAEQTYKTRHMVKLPDTALEQEMFKGCRFPNYTMREARI